MRQQNFFLGEDQRIFRESLARWLAEHWSLAERRRLAASDPGYSREAWTGLAEMGVFGAFLPERAGGAGGGGPELMIAMEGFGRALFASPYLWTVALAAPLLAAAGTAGEELLGRIATGEAIASVALTEAQSRYDLHHVETRARRAGTGYVHLGRQTRRALWGCGRFLGGPGAHLGRPARQGGHFPVPRSGRAPKGWRSDHSPPPTGCAPPISPCAMWRSARGIAGLAWSRAGPAAARRRPRNLAQAAEAVGAMRSLLDSTVAYAKTREQFGATLGSFQALQHRMVDMFAATEMAASHVQAALAGSAGRKMRSTRARPSW